MFDLGVPIFEAIEIQQQEVLILDFFTDSYMVSSWRDGDTFNGLDII